MPPRARKRRQSRLTNVEQLAKLQALGYTPSIEQSTAHRLLSLSNIDDSSESHDSTTPVKGRTTTTTSFTGQRKSVVLGDNDLESLSDNSERLEKNERMSLWDMMRLAERGARKIDARASGEHENVSVPSCVFLESLEQDLTRETQPSVTSEDGSDSDSDSSSSLTTTTTTAPPPQNRRRPLPSVETMQTLVAQHKQEALTRREAWLNRRRPNRDHSDSSDEGATASRLSSPSLASSRGAAPLWTPTTRLAGLALSSSLLKPVTSLTRPRPGQPGSSPSKLDRLLKETTRPAQSITYHSSDDKINQLSLPNFLTTQSQVFGARTLRRRVDWIIETAQTLHRERLKSEATFETRRTLEWFEREVARKTTGRTDEWWRVSKKYHSMEQTLRLDSFQEFSKFRYSSVGEDDDVQDEDNEPTTAVYRAFVDHVKLCGHALDDCQYYQALATFHSYRIPKRKSSTSATSRRIKMPKRFDLNNEEVKREWNEFVKGQNRLSQEFGWPDPLVRKARTPSPKKRKRKQ
ncbi:hypothetical protein ACM66B_002469 [Microbotryomycetes sp. NB124-2]